MKKSILSTGIIQALFLVFVCININASDRILVWSDEFNGSTIDQSVWSYDLGPSNDNVHYYTSRSQNAGIADGILQIIALEESYQGYDYTSALLSTKNAISWRYGRFEARIRLPGSDGFVPAFWMLPADDRYGWWPYSGEIDIMEHPTNQVDDIYGTVHTKTYNAFNGTLPQQGDQVQIADAESAFHVYAVEWTPEQIDFYVDDQNYFTFSNDGAGSDTWPFNQPFYIILNLAVGGGWVGDPHAGTVFPAIMEVDYVRVYQYPEDIILNGPDFCTPEGENAAYFVPEIEGETYTWSVPNRAEIVDGQHTPSVEVDWSIFGGNVELDMGSSVKKYGIEVSSSLVKNGGFEKGVKYWNKTGPFPANADFILSETDVDNGDFSLFIDVLTPGTNPWDAQLSQGGIQLKAGQQYTASFRGKSITGNGEISASVIDAADYSLYGQSNITLTSTWTQYAYDFTPAVNATALFNIDLGGHTGSYRFDDFQLIPVGSGSINQVQNASFSEENDEWNLTTFSPSVAVGEVVEGEYHVSISNGGNATWDINLVQEGMQIEQGERYFVSFDAYASAPREISALVGQNGEPWAVYSGSNVFELSDRRQTFDYSFIMNFPTDDQARVAFDLGGNEEDVVIDNVFLSWGSSSTSLEPPGGKGLKTSGSPELFPNPASGEISVRFVLPEASLTKLEIYNSRGELVETLLNDYLDPGEYTTLWQANEKIPSGLYFIRLTTAEGIVTERLLLMR